LEKKGIPSRVYYPVPVHRQPLHRGANRGVRLPETEKACRDLLALPLFPELTKSELLRVCSAVAAA
jgi:dTDP-4-amino-4,6-dideoxygalactose transaminase